jgi:hypothetical protein
MVPLMPEDQRGGEASRYPLPLYLNQKYVFDVLSMMERGFSQLETITSRQAGEEAAERGVSGGIGFANVFGLLNVSLGGARSRREQSESSEEVSAQRVHTPNSLFARMRERLFEEELVKTSLAEEQLSAGGFVEANMRLEKNPLVEALETLLAMMQMGAIFEDRPSGVGAGQKKGVRRQQPRSETDRNIEQMTDLINQLNTGDVVDLLATPTDLSVPYVVLTLDMAYATDPSLSDLIDGEYRVMGKVTRFIPAGSDETLNLLRKTTLGRLHPSVLDQLKQPFAEMQEGVVLPVIRTVLEPPVVQILPIAVFA